jgi:hypothetical protein
MPIYSVPNNLDFARAPEIFSGIQMGRKNDRYFLVIGCQVAIEFDGDTPSDLNAFYARTWGNERASSGIIKLYEEWMASLKPLEMDPYLTTREGVIAFVASVSFPTPPLFPPPPPNRPDLRPRYIPPLLPQNLNGHLPFETKTRPDEHFYRFEAWPKSLQLKVGDPGIILAKTYASPSEELPFLNTGFAAVARNALPSLFPAVFRYELQPEAGKTIHCGAIVPSYGQSGGGVEVFFPAQVQNRGPIAKPVIVPPL